MAKKLKTIVKTGTTPITKEQSLHSDHHPQLFGKTLIWNIDKDNVNDDLEMKAFAIAQKINKGGVTSGMLQEVPHDSQDKLIANIEKYLNPKQKLSMRALYLNGFLFAGSDHLIPNTLRESVQLSG